MSRLTDDTAIPLPHFSLREKWRLLTPFWTSTEKAKARWRVAGILALTAAEIGLSAFAGFGAKGALDAMFVAHDAMQFVLNTALLSSSAFGLSRAISRREKMTQLLQIQWRGWLTKQFTKAWLDEKSCHLINKNGRADVHPDQRIAEDLSKFPDMTLGLGLGLLRSTVNLATWAAVLWYASPLMLGAAVVFAIAASNATHRIGKPLHGLNTYLQNCEARFRHALISVKDNAETITTAGLERESEIDLGKKFDAVASSRIDLAECQRRVNAFLTLNMQSPMIIPMILAAPQALAGNMTPGSFFLAKQSYTEVYSSLNWFSNGYHLLADWSATGDRLVSFSKALEETKQEITRPAPGPGRTPLGMPRPKSFP